MFVTNVEFYERASFIKDVINRGGGGFAKIWSYLISLFSKNDDKGGRGQKSQKIDDVFFGIFAVQYLK